jgi:hypothetical protein
MANIETIKGRIKKLLALSGSPNEAEAILAMQKCQELMEKYDIRHIDVDETTGKVRVVAEKIRGYSNRHTMWESKLGATIAHSFDAQALILRGHHEWHLVFVAAKTDAEFILYLYKMLRRIISKNSKTYADKRRVGSRKSIRHSYSIGMIMTIHDRLIKLYKELPDERALVVVKEGAIKEYIANEIGKVEKGSDTEISDRDAFKQGLEDGEEVQITPPIAHEADRN